ncbi:MAG: hypothetical protein ABIO81_07285, partial [Ginsengibacter sp.]
QKVEAPKDTTENDAEENDTDNLFHDYKNKSSGNGKGTFLTILIVLALGLGCWAAWNFLFKDNKDTSTSENIVPVNDSSLLNNDTSGNNIVSADTSTMTGQPTSDTVSFNVVVRETTDKQIALTRLAILKSYGRNVIIYTADSITYKVAQSFKLPLSDTTKILDSLNRNFYKGKAYIEVR